MDSKLREVLDQIDTVLAENGFDAAQLWNVLTALRGPDNVDDGDYRTKQEVTVPIRRAAFPRTAALTNNNTADFGDNDSPTTVRVDRYTHFHNHGQAAASALGLRLLHRDID
jgi:hypothetical protein